MTFTYVMLVIRARGNWRLLGRGWAAHKKTRLRMAARSNWFTYVDVHVGDVYSKTAFEEKPLDSGELPNNSCLMWLG